MKKILVITEKPSVGRDIARVLGCKNKGEGYLFSDEYAVTWAIGHLAELFEPEDYDPAYKKWNKNHLPIIPDAIRLKVNAKTRAQFNVIKKLMNGADVGRIICATDSGREGELIFRYIYTLAGCRKPFDRLWISSMTDAAIRDGFNKLKPGSHYDPLYSSAKCRSEADWLVGINASRAYTLRYNTLLSIGRVQTPTLGIIVARQKEIDAFVPEDYFEILARLRADGVEFEAKYLADENSVRIKEAAHADAIMKKLTPKPPAAVVIEEEKQRKSQPHPLLYDLTELQRDANKKFGYTAKATLDIAQKLYEGRKLITYPRTDSRYLSKDMVPKFTGILRKLAEGGMCEDFAGRLLSLDKLPVTKRIVDDSKVSDHHAIIPTDGGKLNLSALPPEERNVFDLIARRFISVFYPNYTYDALTVLTDINGEKFISKGIAVVEEGWMELYRDNKDSDEDNALLPSLKAGDKADVLDIKLLKKKTKPPPNYTESSLLYAMEHAGRFVEDETLKERLKEQGLGTPATRAGIIERLLKVGYIRRKGKALIPLEKGMLLIAAVPPELKTPETTGKWEKGLLSVAKSKMDAGRFMQSIERYVRYIVEQAGSTAPNINFPKEERRYGKKS